MGEIPRHPHFLIVGIMKAATTTLYYHLTCHPRIMAAKYKELHYFTRDYDIRIPNETWGMDYGEMLNVNPDAGDVLYGEASPSYIQPPERIHAYNPDCKIIITLRNPVDRAISQMRHNQEHQFRLPPQGYMKLLQDTFDLSQIDVVYDSFYHDRLERFAQTFPAKNLLVVSYEAFIAN